MGRFTNDTTGVLVSVDDSKDDRFGAGWTREGAEPKATKPAAEKSATPDDSWTNKELDTFASENGIDFTGVSNKPSRLEAIAAHAAASKSAGE
jgi:hypothetical protein